MLAVVAIHFYWQELSSHFFLSADVAIHSFIGVIFSLVLVAVFVTQSIGKSYLLTFNASSCCYTFFLASVIFSFFQLAAVAIQSFYK